MLNQTMTPTTKTSAIAKAEDLLQSSIVWGIGALLTRNPNHALRSAVDAARVQRALRSVPASRKVTRLVEMAVGIQAKQSATFLTLRSGKAVTQ